MSILEDTGLPPKLEEDVNRLFINQTKKELEDLIELRNEIEAYLKDDNLYTRWIHYLMMKNNWPMHIAVYWSQETINEMTDRMLKQMYECLNRLSFYEVIDRYPRTLTMPEIRTLWDECNTGPNNPYLACDCTICQRNI